MKAAIIQARIGSRRLPGKVLEEIEGKPLLGHVLRRAGFSKKIEKIILAIPDTPENDILAKIAEEFNVIVFRGSENNVLDRYLKAAEKYRVDTIVRLTGDCPLIDPAIIDHMLDLFAESKCDYFSNDASFGGHPRGFDVDILSFSALKKAAQLATKDAHKEHIITFILENSDIFKVVHYKAPKELLRPYRLCVDEKEDLTLVRKIFNHFALQENFSALEIIHYLDENPNLADINKSIKQEKPWNIEKQLQF